MTGWLLQRCNDYLNGYVASLLNDDIDIRWTSTANSVICTDGMLATDDLVITTLANGQTWAFDHDGKAVWKHVPPKGRKKSHVIRPPVIEDGVLYVPRESTFESLDLATGTERWVIESRADSHGLTIDNFMEANHPTSRPGRFCSFFHSRKSQNEIILRDTWGLVVVNYETGKYIRRLFSEFQDPTRRPLQPWGDYFLNWTDHTLRVQNRETFETSVKVELPFPLRDAVFTGNNDLLCVVSNTTACCIDITTGQVLWQTTVEPLQSVASTGTDGTHLYIVKRDAVVKLDITDGQELWRTPRYTSQSYLAIALTDNYILLPDDQTGMDEEYGMFEELLSTVDLLDKHTGELVKTLTLNCGQQKVFDLQPSIAVVDNKVFIKGKKELACAW